MPLSERKLEQYGWMTGAVECRRACCEWSTVFTPTAEDGSTLPPEELALSAALEKWHPAHRGLVIRGLDGVARRNVARVVEAVLNQSETIDSLVREGKIMIVGAVYDVVSGDIEFLPSPAREPEGTAAPA